MTLESAVVEQYSRDIKEHIPNFVVESVVFEGEGDFCRAYTVNQHWIFRFAYNSEGSQALEREAALLPRLAPTITLAIPEIAYFGRQRESGLAFVGYPKIEGVELARELLLSLEPPQQELYARAIAGFLDELHSFDVQVVQQLGVVECAYPFCRTEHGILEGNAADLYHQELERLLSYPNLDEETRLYCKWLVQELLAAPESGESQATLIHGDLSQEHILFDVTARRVSGVIDFTDVIISTPMLDYMYLYNAYGDSFLGLLLSHRPDEERQRMTARVQLLHRWYTVLRLLWALDHKYQPGIEARLRELSSLRVASWTKKDA